MTKYRIPTRLESIICLAKIMQRRKGANPLPRLFIEIITHRQTSEPERDERNGKNGFKYGGYIGRMFDQRKPTDRTGLTAWLSAIAT